MKNMMVGLLGVWLAGTPWAAAAESPLQALGAATGQDVVSMGEGFQKLREKPVGRHAVAGTLASRGAHVQKLGGRDTVAVLAQPRDSSECIRPGSAGRRTIKKSFAVSATCDLVVCPDGWKEVLMAKARLVAAQHHRYEYKDPKTGELKSIGFDASECMGVNAVELTPAHGILTLYGWCEKQVEE